MATLEREQVEGFDDKLFEFNLDGIPLGVAAEMTQELVGGKKDRRRRIQKIVLPNNGFSLSLTLVFSFFLVTDNKKPVSQLLRE